MGLREGVLRDAPAPQASLAGGVPQHRLTNGWAIHTNLRFAGL